jgi:hypothetical protein
MTRHKNVNWGLPDNRVGYVQAQIALLMDIRDELQQLNRTFGCVSFLSMTRQLELTRLAIEGLRRDRRNRKSSIVNRKS